MSDKPIHHLIEDNEGLAFECARLDRKCNQLRAELEREKATAKASQQLADQYKREAYKLHTELEKERERANTTETRLNVVVNSISDLINDSHGVAGLHLNGEIAPWE